MEFFFLRLTMRIVNKFIIYGNFFGKFVYFTFIKMIAAINHKLFVC